MNEEIKEMVTDFVKGLLKHIKCNHAGNCYAMCQVLKPYLSALFGINTLITNCKVIQNGKEVNHYYLSCVKDGSIIDGTAAQFVNPSGARMPQVYFGDKPKWYLTPDSNATKQSDTETKSVRAKS